MMEGSEAPAAASGVVPPGAEVRDRTAAAGAMQVVAAVDASEESLHALAWAIDNILGLNPRASLVVVHAQHRVDTFIYPVAAHAVAYAPAAAMENMRKAQEEISRKVVARALELCTQKQVSATAAVMEGDAKEAICQAVEEMHADLLVLGSRGLGKIKRALLGSVSDYLAHHACCPVLVVKPPKAHS